MKSAWIPPSYGLSGPVLYTFACCIKGLAGPGLYTFACCIKGLSGPGLCMLHQNLVMTQSSRPFVPRPHEAPHGFRHHMDYLAPYSTPLHVASKFGHDTVVKNLIEAEAKSEDMAMQDTRP